MLCHVLLAVVAWSLATWLLIGLGAYVATIVPNRVFEPILIATLFLFILFSNLIGLIPGSYTVTVTVNSRVSLPPPNGSPVMIW